MDPATNETLDRMLRHMAWANGRALAILAELPEEALAVVPVGSTWSVGATLAHLVTAADAYARTLTGGPRPVERRAPTSREEVRALASILAAADETIRSAALLPGEEILTWHGSDGAQRTNWRWVLIDQAIHHATEHRAQIAAALAAAGRPDLDLDELDVWAYAEGL